MNLFTLTCNLLGKIENSKEYIAQILYRFTAYDNPYKVCIDKDKKVLDYYGEIARTNPLIAQWIIFMGQIPANFEFTHIELPTELDKEEHYIYLCSKIKGSKKMIVYSHQDWERFDYDDEESSIITYQGNKIRIIDRDEAILELKVKESTTNIHSSVIGKDNSDLSGIKIGNN